MGNAIKSVTSGLCACVLTSSLVVVPPDHGARPESQAVQLAAFTFPSTAQLAANLEEYLRDAAQTRALVASVTPGGGPDAVAPPTFKSATDPAISTQQVIDAAPALALLDPGVYAGPLDLLLSFALPILGLLSSPGAIILFAPIFGLIFLSPIIVPVLFVVSLITGLAGGAALAVPLAAAAPFAAAADVDAKGDPTSTDDPEVSRFATATTAMVEPADAVSDTETVQADLAAQETADETSDTSVDTDTDTDADEAETENVTETAEAEEDSATVTEATETESDSTTDLAEAAGRDDVATSKKKHAETAGTGEASTGATAADSHEPSSKPSSVGSSSAGSSSADGDSSDGNSSGGDA